MQIYLLVLRQFNTILLINFLSKITSFVSITCLNESSLKSTDFVLSNTLSQHTLPETKRKKIREKKGNTILVMGSFQRFAFIISIHSSNLIFDFTSKKRRVVSKAFRYNAIRINNQEAPSKLLFN